MSDMYQEDRGVKIKVYAGNRPDLCAHAQYDIPKTLVCDGGLSCFAQILLKAVKIKSVTKISESSHIKEVMKLNTRSAF